MKKIRVPFAYNLKKSLSSQILIFFGTSHPYITLLLCNPALIIYLQMTFRAAHRPSTGANIPHAIKIKNFWLPFCACQSFLSSYHIFHKAKASLRFSGRLCYFGAALYTRQQRAANKLVSTSENSSCSSFGNSAKRSINLRNFLRQHKRAISRDKKCCNPLQI